MFKPCNKYLELNKYMWRPQLQINRALAQVQHIYNILFKKLKLPLKIHVR